MILLSEGVCTKIKFLNFFLSMVHYRYYTTYRWYVVLHTHIMQECSV
jgi:hypothetical protein